MSKRGGRPIVEGRVHTAVQVCRVGHEHSSHRKERDRQDTDMCPFLKSE
jgi:hypothetical protein